MSASYSFFSGCGSFLYAHLEFDSLFLCNPGVLIAPGIYSIGLCLPWCLKCRGNPGPLILQVHLLFIRTSVFLVYPETSKANLDIFLNRCLCCITAQHNTFGGKRYLHSSSQMAVIGLCHCEWQVRVRRSTHPESTVNFALSTPRHCQDSISPSFLDFGSRVEVMTC